MRTASARSHRNLASALALTRRLATTARRHGGWKVGRATGPEPERALFGLLFTDIVGSTALVERVGDARWAALLAAHQVIVRRQLALHDGSEVDDTGDGFFCSFTSPSRAVRCAQAIQAAGRVIGVDIRAGVHAGECERRQGRLRGIAVHVGARIAALAAPGEIRVSATVYELVAGSGLVFTDEAWCSLPGVSKPCLLYRAAPSLPKTSDVLPAASPSSTQKEAETLIASAVSRTESGTQ